MDVVRQVSARKLTKPQKLAIGAGLAVVVAAVSIASLQPALPKIARDAVVIDAVKAGDMVRNISGPGTLVAKENRLIPAILPKARVERVLLLPGTVVKADSVLMHLSNPLIKQQLDDARLRVEVAAAEYEALRARLNDEVLKQESQVSSVRAQYKAAALQMESEAKLIADHIVSELQFKKSTLNAEQLQAQLENESKRLSSLPRLNAAELNAKAAQLQLVKRELSLQEDLFAALTVTAGIDGIVQEIRVKEGQGVDQGDILALISRQDRLKAEVRIIESQAREVAVGQAVLVEISSDKKQGVVSRVDPSVQNGTVTVDVDFTGELPAGARPNLRVNATIQIEKLANVLYVGKPVQGVQGGEVRLFKVDDSGVATLTTAVLGKSSVSTVQVVSGLAEGDRIILSDVTGLPNVEQFQLN